MVIFLRARKVELQLGLGSSNQGREMSENTSKRGSGLLMLFGLATLEMVG